MVLIFCCNEASNTFVSLFNDRIYQCFFISQFSKIPLPGSISFHGIMRKPLPQCIAGCNLLSDIHLFVALAQTPRPQSANQYSNTIALLWFIIHSFNFLSIHSSSLINMDKAITIFQIQWPVHLIAYFLSYSVCIFNRQLSIDGHFWTVL